MNDDDLIRIELTIPGSRRETFQRAFKDFIRAMEVQDDEKINCTVTYLEKDNA